MCGRTQKGIPFPLSFIFLSIFKESATKAAHTNRTLGEQVPKIIVYPMVVSDFMFSSTTRKRLNMAAKAPELPDLFLEVPEALVLLLSLRVAGSGNSSGGAVITGRWCLVLLHRRARSSHSPEALTLSCQPFFPCTLRKQKGTRALFPESGESPRAARSQLRPDRVRFVPVRRWAHMPTYAQGRCELTAAAGKSAGRGARL